MKNLLTLLTLIILSSCGGRSDHSEPEKELWEIQAELCEAQGLGYERLHIFNVDTGEETREARCVKLSCDCYPDQEECGC